MPVHAVVGGVQLEHNLLLRPPRPLPHQPSRLPSPTSKAASKARTSTTPKSNRSALQSDGIGALLGSEKSRCCTTTVADSRPGALQHCEKCGLARCKRLRYRLSSSGYSAC